MSEARLQPVVASPPSLWTERLDHHAWQARLAFEVYGVRFAVRSDDPALAEALIARLPSRWLPVDYGKVDAGTRVYSMRTGIGARRRPLAFIGGARLANPRDWEQVLDALETDLRLHVAEWSPARLFVHAGVVAWRGRAILLPGPSFSGKSALVRALLEAGATYYADDCAVLDDAGRVHPFATAVGVRERDGGEAHHRVPARAFGASTGAGPAPVSLIAFTRYRAGARWRPGACSAGGCVLRMLSHTPAARHRPGDALRMLGQTAAGAASIRGERGEASGVAADLLRRAEEAPPQ